MRTSDTSQRAPVSLWERLIGTVTFTNRSKDAISSASEEEGDVFALALESQLYTMHQLELWRNAKKPRFLTGINCPSRPRLLAGVLTPEEKEHLEICSHCRYVVESVYFYEIRCRLSRIRVWCLKHIETLAATLQSWSPRQIKVHYLFCAGVLFLGGFLPALEHSQRSSVSDKVLIDLMNLQGRSVNLEGSKKELLSEIGRLTLQVEELQKAQRPKTQRAADAGNGTRSWRQTKLDRRHSDRTRTIRTEGVLPILGGQITSEPPLYLASPKDPSPVGTVIYLNNKELIKCARLTPWGLTGWWQAYNRFGGLEQSCQ